MGHEPANGLTRARRGKQITVSGNVIFNLTLRFAIMPSLCNVGYY
jgi:hypothetical protein